MAVVRELCVKFADENPSWGYGRIQGALANVGYEISMTTVGNILRAKGICPAPERSRRGNWRRFIRSQLDVAAVADFFTTEVWTLRGLVRYQVFFRHDPRPPPGGNRPPGLPGQRRGHGASGPQPDRLLRRLPEGRQVLHL